MPRTPPPLASLPPAAQSALLKLGQDLGIARKRRKESLKSWAARLGVSVPTLMKLEKGDPTVSMGAYAMALWLAQRHEALAELADPALDAPALEAEVIAARERHARKSRD
ncbi:MAG TPA: XRE family transcriptional regulator [Ramlibacter sp.]|nr:XRE family transcriptional regulator [Ramlibacter sp.]